MGNNHSAQGEDKDKPARTGDGADVGHGTDSTRHLKVEYSDPVQPHEYESLASHQAELKQAAAEVQERRSLGCLRRESRGEKAWLKYSAMGIQMAVMMVVPALIGWWIDTEAESKPWGLVIGCSFGAFAGMFYVIFTVLRDEKKQGR